MRTFKRALLEVAQKAPPPISPYKQVVSEISFKINKNGKQYKAVTYWQVIGSSQLNWIATINYKNRTFMIIRQGPSYTIY